MSSPITPPDAVAKVRRVAKSTLAEYGTADWLEGPCKGAVTALLEARLDARPVDDQRIDFEDGYGPRGDEEEDGHAKAAALAVAEALHANALPPLLGIRVKSFGPATRRRAERTLATFFAFDTTERQAFGVKEDLGQRRSKLVRDPRRELLMGPLEPLGPPQQQETQEREPTS